MSDKFDPKSKDVAADDSNATNPDEWLTVSSPETLQGGPTSNHGPRSYQIIRELGRGGMGVVYLAEQPNLNRRVAIKSILGGNSRTGDAISRFHREARAAAMLNHPGIVPVYDYWQENGDGFICMAFVEGEILSTRLASNGINHREAARILGEVAEAIDYAHRHGVIHRDLKPSNIMLNEKNQAVVTDFGLAKISDVDSTHELTLTGQVLGTPAYMSPEQASGKTRQIGIASDIYSLGATLYHCITGRPPFVADSVPELLMEICSKEPNLPCSLSDTVDKDLEAICMKCLEKSPRDRYQSAKEVANDLASYLDGRPILARRVNFLEYALKWCRRNPAESALITCLMIVVALVVSIFGGFFQNAAMTADSAPSNNNRLLLGCAMTGPFFSLCHWVGIARIRRFESGILHLMQLLPVILLALGAVLLYFLLIVCWALGGRILKVLPDDSIVLALLEVVIPTCMYAYTIAVYWQRKHVVRFWLCLLAIPISVGGIIFALTFEQILLNVENQTSNLWTTILDIVLIGTCFVVLLPAFITILCIVLTPIVDLNHYQSVLAHKTFRKFKSRVATSFGFVPFPLNRLSNSYNYDQALWLQIWSPILIVLFSLSFAVMIILLIAGIPFWIAEQLRRILTPNRPLFMDLVMYALSFATIAVIALSSIQ